MKIKGNIGWVLALSLLSILGSCASETTPSIEVDETPTETADTLHITLKEKHLSKLTEIREAAIEAQKLESSSNKYVKAEIDLNGVPTKVKVRLKGDLPDHWKGNRWSLRVKTRDDGRIYDMEKFSLQDPMTRNGAWEWLFHKLLEDQGLIHLNYDFAHITQNQQYKGVYAIEGHFTSSMLELNNLPRSAILCYDESAYWATYEKIPDDRPAMYKVYRDNFDWAYPKFYMYTPQPDLTDSIDFELRPTTSAVEPIQDEAFDLLVNFQKDSATTSETFDVDQLAKYVALCDYLGAWHGLLWGNMRFYYNQDLKRLQPIGFDADAGYEIEQLAEKNEKLMQLNGTFHHHLFEDSIFVEAYRAALLTLADETYWSNFLKKHENETQKIVALIQQNDPNYKFSPALIDHNRVKIQEALGADN